MSTANNMHNLTTLIKRLEAATSRLEDIATSTELPKGVPALTHNVASPPDTSAVPTPPPVPKALPEPPSGPLPEAVEEYDIIISSTVGKYVKLSNDLGGSVAKQAAEVLKGFQEQRKFVLITTKAKRPEMSGSDMVAFQNLLKPINDALMAVSEIREANRADPMYTNLSAVADGIMVLAWVTIDNRPYKHVEECLGSAQFFGNRVQKEQKEKDPKQIEWLQAFYEIFRELTDYVKHFYAAGITWNPNGESAQEVAKSLTSGTSPPPALVPGAAGAAPPPPPPPGPPPVLDIKAENSAAPAPAAAPAGGFGAVFSELNKGEGVTKGLRKVEKSEMTHKNPSLRAGSTVPDDDGSARAKSPAPGKKPKPENMRVKKPGRKELGQNKWTVENFEKEPQPIEVEALLNHSVFIDKCNNTTVIVKGKANLVAIANCTRLSLVVDSLVCSVDVVKASDFALQVMGAVPTVMLDQVDGGTIYFSKESTSTKVFTSKSVGINLNVISGPDEDYKEVPLPAQICSYYDEEKNDLVNEIVAHAG